MEHCGSRYSCGICERKFYDYDLFSVHISIHRGEKPYKCDICKKSFKFMSELNFHRAYHNPGVQHNCDMCTKTFRSLPRIKAHIKLAHTSKKTYKCETCGELRTTVADIRNHRKVHTIKEEYPYKCGVCQQTFAMSREYVEHVPAHDMAALINQCNCCDKIYATVEKLTMHVRTNKGERPYKCELCPRTFSMANTLGHHLNTMHRMEKPHQCSICGQSYVQYASLKNHMRQHDGSKYCQCKLCHKLLTVAYYKRHMYAHKMKKQAAKKKKEQQHALPKIKVEKE